MAPTSLLCFCASDFASAAASFALAALDASTYSFDTAIAGASGAGIEFGAYGALL